MFGCLITCVVPIMLPNVNILILEVVIELGIAQHSGDGGDRM